MHLALAQSVAAGAKATAKSLRTWNTNAALLVRAGVIEDIVPRPFQYESMPLGVAGPGTRDTDQYRHLWKTFFAASITQVSDAESSRPMFIYFNPVAQVVLISQWNGFPDRPISEWLCAIPSEAISGDTQFWTAQPNALDAMTIHSKKTIEAIGKQFPLTAATKLDAKALCKTANQRLAEQRLIWLLGGLEEIRKSGILTPQLLAPLNGAATETSLTSSWPQISDIDRQRLLAMGPSARDFLPAGAVLTADNGSLFFVAHKSTARLYALVLSPAGKSSSVRRFMDVDVRRTRP